MKKTLSIILSVLILVSVFATAFSAFAYNTRSVVPVIYMRGRGTELYTDPGTPESKQIYPLSYPDDYIMTKAKEILPVLAKAMVTQNWDDYCDSLYNAVSPIFEEIMLDENGNPKNNSGIDWNWPANPLNDKKSNGTYNIYDYVFRYDWRIDPCEAADSLNDYVKDVKRATGADKVALISRCYATNIVMAYLTEYGHDDVDTIEMYASTINGVVSCGELFAGKLALDGDAIERYVDESVELSDENLDRLLKASVALFNKDYKLDIAADIIEGIYNKVESNVVPRLLNATFATMPAYWSMIGEEDYEDAKTLVFSGTDGKYDGLIAKLDNYHYNVQLKAFETLKQCQEDGVKVAIIAKYGYQVVPIVEDSDEITDDTIRLSDAAFNATCAQIDAAFSDEYLKKAQENGTYKYISPEKSVDASTCLFPDSTWFIRDVHHIDFPDCINELLIAIVNFDGQMTVNDNESYPQYLIYNAENSSISPLTEENCGKAEKNNNIFVLAWNFLKALFAFIKDYINKK